MSWEQSLDRWLTTPPEEDEDVVEDSLGNLIYKGESYCAINGMILSEESLEDVSSYLHEHGESFECAGCGVEYGDDYDEKYYEINGEMFCINCVSSSMIED